MYQAGMLAPPGGHTDFLQRADLMYVELCRSVSIQLISRTESGSATRESLNQFAAGMQIPHRRRRTLNPNPANRKEEASV
ncbi:MAG: hypothetical protein R3E56_20885 [Burkholderiaceae bacterium]